jgi:hypothetical protein
MVSIERMSLVVVDLSSERSVDTRGDQPFVNVTPATISLGVCPMSDGRSLDGAPPGRDGYLEQGGR